MTTVNSYLLPDFVADGCYPLECWTQFKVINQRSRKVLWLVVRVADVPLKAFVEFTKLQMDHEKVLPWANPTPVTKDSVFDHGFN